MNNRWMIARSERIKVELKDWVQSHFAEPMTFDLLQEFHSRFEKYGETRVSVTSVGVFFQVSDVSVGYGDYFFQVSDASVANGDLSEGMLLMTSKELKKRRRDPE